MFKVFNQSKKTTVRTVMLCDDGLFHVLRRSIFDNWRLDSAGYTNKTSAWAQLGRMTAAEQSGEPVSK